MINRLISIFVLLMLVKVLAIGQASNTEEQKQSHLTPPFEAVIVPRNVVLPMVVHQSDCPLKLEVAGLEAILEGGGKEIYKFRNQGNKTIKAFKIAYLFPGGTGGSYDVKDEWLFPGTAFPADGENQWEKSSFTKVIPLTEEIRKQMKMDKGMQGILILMVVRVEFVDGSIFDDEIAYQALQAYLDKINIK